MYTELDKIFDEYLTVGRKNITINQLTDMLSSSVVVFGAGNLGISIVRCLRSYNIEPLCFCDNDYGKQNTTIENLKVLSPSEIKEKYNEVQFIVCMYTKEEEYEKIKKQLVELGHLNIMHAFELRNCRVLFEKVNNILPIGYDDDVIIKNKESIYRVYSLLADNESKELFLAILRFRLLDIDFHIPALPAEKQYFDYDIYKQIEHERVVDCGAYIGDTLLSFIGYNENFDKYYAFEPDPKNGMEIQNIIKEKERQFNSRVKLFPYAVSDKKELLFFENQGTSYSAISSFGKTQIQCVDLDTYIYDEKITLLKMDIESYEVNALLGAKKTITEQMPTLAICVYHLTQHLWEIPLLIESMNPNYKLYLRSYNNLMEIVCYAVPEERALFK